MNNGLCSWGFLDEEDELMNIILFWPFLLHLNWAGLS